MPIKLTQSVWTKAFDKVSHEIKSHSYQIRGSALYWINSIINGRTQRVVLEGEESSPLNITSGVPQDSVLGPILFLAYINDLPEVQLFADDTIVYLVITEPSESFKLQVDLEKLEELERTWDIRCPSYNRPNNKGYRDNLHPTRHTGRSTRKIPWHHIIQYTILEYTYHQCRKANHTLSMMHQNLWNCPSNVKSTAYTTLGSPHYRGCKLGAARFVKRDYSRFSSVTTVLQDLGWKTFVQRREDARPCLFYKIVHNQVEKPRQNYLIPISRPMRHHHSNSFRIPYSSKNSYKHSFFPLPFALGCTPGTCGFPSLPGNIPGSSLPYGINPSHQMLLTLLLTCRVYFVVPNLPTKVCYAPYY